MLNEILICVLSVLLGMTIMLLIFLLRDSHPYEIHKPKPKRIEVGTQSFWIEETKTESIKRNIKNLFSIPKYKFLIVGIFAIGLGVGIYLGYEMMQEINKGIEERQQKSHISYIIEDYQNKYIISKGGDFVEKDSDQEHDQRRIYQLFC